ncbi:DJ-1/PfpI family protein [Sorangium sp. So ce269]
MPPQDLLHVRPPPALGRLDTGGSAEVKSSLRALARAVRFDHADLIGPQNVLAAHATTHLLWKDRALVPSDSGVSIQPTATFSECPDILFVPGGPGTAEAMADQEILRFLRDRGPRSRYVTSVCTGSLVLAAAGLMQGYKATTHWATRHTLDRAAMDVLAARELAFQASGDTKAVMVRLGRAGHTGVREPIEDRLSTAGALDPLDITAGSGIRCSGELSCVHPS